MKRIFQITTIVILALTFALSLFSFTGAGSEMAAGNICPNVDWNTRSTSCSFAAAPNLEGFAYQLPTGIITPNVGWNT